MFWKASLFLPYQQWEQHGKVILKRLGLDIYMWRPLQGLLHKRGNRLRYTSDPVRAKLSPVTYINDRMSNDRANTYYLPCLVIKLKLSISHAPLQNQISRSPWNSTQTSHVFLEIRSNFETGLKPVLFFFLKLDQTQMTKCIYNLFNNTTRRSISSFGYTKNVKLKF